MQQIQPQDIQCIEPHRFCYGDTLGKASWERIATLIIWESQKRGFWVCRRNTFSETMDVVGMKKQKLVTENGCGLELTEKAKRKIWEQYPVYAAQPVV